MRSLVRFVPLVLTGGLALGLACGGDSTGPSAASVTGVAGDSQVAPTGAQLTFPLSLVVLNGSGQPLAGVQVSWTVTPAGAASFNPTTSTSDATGTAATTVTLGATLGDIVIRANVPGVTPVTFHATAVDPCTYDAPYTLGATASGSLATTDCNVGGYYYDFYRLDLPSAQQGIRIAMNSSVIDPFVDLYRLTGEAVGFNDDSISGVFTSSRLFAIVTSGAYVMGANSFDQGETGAYTLSAATHPVTFANCQLVWVTRGVTVTDAISTTDCDADTTVAGTDYQDFVAIFADAGSVLTIWQRSTAVNSRLELRSGAGVLVAENDDSTAGSNDSFITYTVPTLGPYVILPGTSTAGATGAYTLEVSASTTLSGTARAERAPSSPQLLRFAPLRLPKGWQPGQRERRGH